MHSPWLTYIKERYPLPVYVLLSTGMAWQGQLALQPTLQGMPAIVGPLLLMLFFFCLRLMDEVKDYQKDVIAHPERPLPRGLITVAAAKKVIVSCLLLQVVLGLILIGTGLTQAGLFWLLTTLWLYLMYVEFYCGRWLEQRPFFYATTHQIIIVPLVLSAAHLTGNGTSQPAFWSGVTILGAFFTYEIARKLDPNAHELLRTYRRVLGRRATILRLAITCAVAVVGAYFLVPHHWGFFVGISGVTWLVCAFEGDRRPKTAEVVATMGLLYYIWEPVYTLWKGHP